MNESVSEDSIRFTEEDEEEDGDEFERLNRKLVDYHKSKVQELTDRITRLESQSRFSLSPSSFLQKELKNILNNVYDITRPLNNIPHEVALQDTDPSQAILTITNRLVENIQTKSLEINELTESLEYYRLKYKKLKSQLVLKNMTTSPKSKEKAVSPEAPPMSPTFSNRNLQADKSIQKSPLIGKDAMDNRIPRGTTAFHNSTHKKRILLDKFNIEDNAIPSKEEKNVKTEQNPIQTAAPIKYNSVVRNRVERSTLHGASCPCCSSYYKAVHRSNVEQTTGCVSPAVNPENAIMDKPIPSQDNDQTKNVAEAIDGDASEDKSHQRRISRHRYMHIPPSTPPGYWDVCFTPPIE